MVHFLFILFIFPSLAVAATLSEIFTHANDGAVLAGHPTLECRSADCLAIKTQHISNCTSDDCRAIVQENEFLCFHLDCSVVIYARKQGLLSRDLAAALCVSPNCIAIATQSPNEAQDMDGVTIEQLCPKYKTDQGDACFFPETTGLLIKEWQDSVYYNPANLKESFSAFYANRIAERKPSLGTTLKHIKLKPESESPLLGSKRRNSQNRACALQ